MYATQEIIDLYESVVDMDSEITLFKERIKENNAEITRKFKDFAADKEVSVKNLKKGFDHWKEAKQSDDPKAVESELYSLLADIDIYLDEELNKTN